MNWCENVSIQAKYLLCGIAACEHLYLHYVKFLNRLFGWTLYWAFFLDARKLFFRESLNWHFFLRSQFDHLLSVCTRASEQRACEPRNVELLLNLLKYPCIFCTLLHRIWLRQSRFTTSGSLHRGTLWLLATTASPEVAWNLVREKQKQTCAKVVIFLQLFPQKNFFITAEDWRLKM